MSADMIGTVKRNYKWSQIDNKDFDIVIIGGGISGANLFARAATEGYKVLLVEKGDFGSATSQASGMMIWGGLLYMKNFDFPTIISLCRDRDSLISQYPSTIRPQYYYYLPLRRGWHITPLLKAGLNLYHLLGGMRRGRNYIVKNLQENSLIQTEKFRNPIAYEEGMLNYSDCQFVVDLIRLFDSERAIPLNYAEFYDAEFSKTGKRWRIQLKDNFAQRSTCVTSKLVINSSGPYCDEVNQLVNIDTPYKHVLSKGVYLAFRRPENHNHPLIFQMNHNGDVQTFVPWGPVSIWGPTETKVDTIADTNYPTIDDVQFLLKQANWNLNKNYQNKDIISVRSGVRALAVPKSFHADKYPLELSRHYRIYLDEEKNWISVYGGKFTSGNTLTSMVMKKISKVLKQPLYSPATPNKLIDRKYTFRYPDINATFTSPNFCINHEYCLTVEDYLRRRTNIAQWAVRSGLGKDNKYHKSVLGIIRQMPERPGQTAEEILELYKSSTDKLFTNITG